MLLPMLGILIIGQLALAEPTHGAIPVNGVDGLSEPHFQSSTTGWTALVDGGFVAVFVGRDASAAQAWIEQKTTALEIYKPKHNPEFLELTGVDVSLGDGKGLVLFRSRNVAAMCRHRSNATHWAKLLHGSITELSEPWPSQPSLKLTNGLWVPEPSETTIHFQFMGGKTATTPELGFTTKPDSLVAWDSWGRVSVSETDE